MYKSPIFKELRLVETKTVFINGNEFEIFIEINKCSNEPSKYFET